jgi:hypothetical protein
MNQENHCDSCDTFIGIGIKAPNGGNFAGASFGAGHVCHIANIGTCTNTSVNATIKINIHNLN